MKLTTKGQANEKLLPKKRTFWSYTTMTISVPFQARLPTKKIKPPLRYMSRSKRALTKTWLSEEDTSGSLPT